MCVLQFLDGAGFLTFLDISCRALGSGLCDLLSGADVFQLAVTDLTWNHLFLIM